MTKKKPRGHNIGGTPKQKRRKENKGQYNTLCTKIFFMPR